MFDTELIGTKDTGEVTFKADPTITKEDIGKAVRISDSKTVMLSGDDNPVYGKITAYEDGFVTVQTKGYADFTFTEVLTMGLIEINANDEGGIKPVAAPGDGAFYWIVDIDNEDNIVTIDLDYCN